MMRYYQGNEYYHVEDKGAYKKISSAQGAYKIELYVNHPDQSPDEIIDDLAGKKGATMDDVEIEAVIHRGHSYNLDNTMPYFSRDNVFVVLGSCGGFNNVSRLLDIAPDAQIASTKQMGTMFVNDPLLYHLNETIRAHGEIDWADQQNYLDSLSNANKSAYVLPHKNAP
ncbi:MAG: hypothetical protein CMH27_02905 [Micavibrio sp.]|nr:hypothetical protein [Micavibrio sp.]